MIDGGQNGLIACTNNGTAYASQYASVGVMVNTSTNVTVRNLTITNKILQYSNAGLAVVASDTAGQREVLGRAGGAGIAVPLDNAEALARVLDSLLADRAALAKLGTDEKLARFAQGGWNN